MSEYMAFCTAEVGVPPREDQTIALTETLAGRNPTASALGVWIEAGFDVRAASVTAATLEAMSIWEKALVDIGLADRPTVSLVIQTRDFVDAENARGALPEMVGIGEVAELLGLSRQRASQVARSSRFPTPIAELKAGPVFTKASVERFARSWARKPGRPRTA